MVATLQVLIYFVFMLAIFGLALWALIDLLRRPPAAFVSAGKRTKGFWGAIVGVATAVSFASVPFPTGLPQFGLFLALPCAAAAIIYLVDVRPAVAPYSRRRPPSSGPSRGGGW
ncbi:DUF2516 family protein [Cellulomonas sp. PhB150]|uniref:DUF2516 family protein n=1 Tax=Cellulomonas sp. PhB150 TaxID=2485188 RepID=UPI000F46A417|nr:DUF2516 family protein [Cellulomonas sp. PhB150]ROS23568.1 uncharacterized protein DUF2516 [Cellulomonas sp. PhB150]